MLNSENSLTDLNSNRIATELLKFKQALINKAEKISSSDNSYKIGVHIIPKLIKEILAEKNPSVFWAFEGSVGRGTWSRTPWIAIYDERVTTRASDGFFITLIISEDKESVFLTLMNSSSKHHNYTPYRLNLNQVKAFADFNLGKIPKKELSISGRGSGPDFEDSTLIWKKYLINKSELTKIENDFLKLTDYYLKLVDSLQAILPKDKPFKFNPFINK